MLKRLQQTVTYDKKKLVTSVCISLVICIIACIYVSNTIRKSKNKSNSTLANAEEYGMVYVPTEEEKAIFAKSFESFDADDYLIFSDLEGKYNSMSEEMRQNIKSDVVRIRKEEDSYFEECTKQSDENKQSYEDLTKEIEASCPEMNVDSINGKDNEKSIMIDMKLQKNISEAEEKSIKLVSTKDEAMKSIGISSIRIFVKDKDDKKHGCIVFDLVNGEFNLAINTVN